MEGQEGESVERGGGRLRHKSDEHAWLEEAENTTRLCLSGVALQVSWLWQVLSLALLEAAALAAAGQRFIPVNLNLTDAHSRREGGRGGLCVIDLHSMRRSEGGQAYQRSWSASRKGCGLEVNSPGLLMQVPVARSKSASHLDW